VRRSSFSTSIAVKFGDLPLPFGERAGVRGRGTDEDENRGERRRTLAAPLTPDPSPRGGEGRGLRLVFCRQDVAIAFVICLWTTIVFGDERTSAPMSADIDRAILQLDDPSFSVRERASDFLWRAGSAAEAALERAMRSDSREVVVRARQVLKKIRLGITPDLPADVVALVYQFERGEPAEKLQAWRALIGRGQFDVLLKLLDSATGTPNAGALTNELAERIDEVVIAMLVKGELAQAERWLMQFCHRDGPLMRHYVAFLLNTDRIDDRSRELFDSGLWKTDRNAARLLSRLLVARGELARARDVAGHSGDEALVSDLLFRQRNWPELSRRSPASETKPTLAGLGYLSAFQRLADDGDGFTRSVEQMKRLAAEGLNPATTQRVFGKAMQLHGRWDDALEAYRAVAPEQAFDLLVAQGRFREAFDLLGLRPPSSVADWYRDLANDKRIDFPSTLRVQIGLRAARGLYLVGERDAAAALVAEIRQVDLKRPQWLDVCRMAAQVGWHDLAFDQAADLLFARPTTSEQEFVPPGQVFEALFRRQGLRALVLWHASCEQKPHEDRRLILRRVASLIGHRFGRDVQPMNIGQSLRELELAAKLLETSRVTAGINRASWPTLWLQSFAETALLYGDRELARHYYERAATVASSAEPLVHVGDTWADDRQWEPAARAYSEAVERDPRDALARYLHGYALQQLGQLEPARAQMRLAILVPIGHLDRRHQLAMGLAERGLLQPALRQYRMLLAVGSVFNVDAPSEPLVLDAAQRIANLVGANDPAAAAANWDVLAIGCLSPLVNLEEPDAYAKVFHHTCRMRAVGHLVAGRDHDAVEFARFGQSALPLQVQLPIDLVPEFERHDRPDLADDLLTRQFTALDGLAAEFPRFAGVHNDWAWLAAKCGRRLPDALTHARRAVELVSDSATYLDTLADVQFQLGDREAALANVQRCLELEPRNRHFQQQRVRFEARER